MSHAPISVDCLFSMTLCLDSFMHHPYLGRAVQVDTIKPTLKPPGTKHLELKCDILLSSFAFKFHLRRYTWARRGTRSFRASTSTPRWGGAG